MANIDFAAAREQMVDTQVRPNSVSNHAVIAQFLQTPREIFVPEDRRNLAYIDEDVALLQGSEPRWLMKPMDLAKLIQLAGIQKTDFVLDIACASGYSTAILAGLAQSVVATESHVDLIEDATENLQTLGVDNAAVISASLTEGCPSEAPFDVILVGGSVDYVPGSLFDQLKDGGRLVTAIGHGNAGVAMCYRKLGGIVSAQEAFNCAVKPIPGFEKAAEFQL